MSEPVRSVALLGAGIMGAGMGANLVAAGLDVRTWNRTREKAEAIDGATVAGTPAQAADGADVVLTMLADDEAVRVVMSEEDGALDAMRDGAVWIQSSTIGIDATTEMTDRASDYDIGFVDAPILGTRAPAENGELVVLASGAPADVERCAPVFDAIGARTVSLGAEPGAATRMKLVLNAWLLAQNVNVAETLKIAEVLGVDPEQVLAILDGHPVGSPYLQTKGGAILAGDYDPPSFPLAYGTKDLALVVEAATDAGFEPVLAAAALHRFSEAQKAGDGKLDMAAVHKSLPTRDPAEPPPVM